MAEHKPSDYFLTTSDVFGILLPGAAFTFLLLTMKFRFMFVGGKFDVLDPFFAHPKENVSQWIAFVIVSYLLGQIVTQLASGLDSLVYGKYIERKRRRTNNALLMRALALKQEMLGEYDQIQNAFKWSRAYVRLHKPELAAEIDRFEATSKMFRSLIIILALACGLQLATRAWGVALMIAIVLTASLLVYINQRQKMTETAYLYFIMLKEHPVRLEEKKLVS